MPLIPVLRVLLMLVSLAILAASGYLFWSWWEGELVTAPDGVLIRTRDDWRLWVAIALLAWSFLGRLLTPLIVARRDTDPTKPKRDGGRLIEGGSGSLLYVESHGEAAAPTLILTHGWGLDSTIWSYARRDLASRFRVLTWDLPGLGRSKPAPGGRPSLSDFAADLHSLVELAGGPVVLVGHSIGGMTIQTLARDYPETFGKQVVGVVLLNTTYSNPLKTMVLSGLAQAIRWPLLEPMMRLAIWLQPLAWLGAWQSYLSGSAHLANRIGFGRHVTRSQLEHTTLLATRNPPGRQAQGNLAMFRWDATDALAGLPAPALVIGGDMDIVTKLEASRRIVAGAPGATLLTVGGVNHMGFLERADVYNAAIAEFAGARFAQQA